MSLPVVHVQAGGCVVVSLTTDREYVAMLTAAHHGLPGPVRLSAEDVSNLIDDLREAASLMTSVAA